MKISRDNVTKAFNDYVNEYDTSNEMIHLKSVHTLKVASNCDAIARSLDLNEEEIDLGWLIGMCHDMARFRQFTEYGTFNDAVSIDHAELGCKMLFDEGLIFNFIDESAATDYELSLIDKAIRYHSLYRLPEDLTKEELMYCNIIRDADKIDIFRVSVEEPINNVYSATREELLNSEISPKVMEAFYEHHAILRKLRQNMLDVKVGHVSLAFELVYDRSKELAVEQGYIFKIIEDDYTKEATLKQVALIQQELKEYLAK